VAELFGDEPHAIGGDGAWQGGIPADATLPTPPVSGSNGEPGNGSDGIGGG
jgi:hypothetical protein